MASSNSGNRFASFFNQSASDAAPVAVEAQENTRKAFPIQERRYERQSSGQGAPTSQMPSAFSRTREQREERTPFAAPRPTAVPESTRPNPFGRQRQDEGRDQAPSAFSRQGRGGGAGDETPSAFGSRRGRDGGDDTPSAFGSRPNRDDQRGRERYNQQLPKRVRTPTPPPVIEDTQAFPEIGAAAYASKKKTTTKEFTIDLSEETALKKAQEQASKGNIPRFSSGAKKTAAEPVPAPAPAPVDDFPSLAAANPAPAKMSWAALAKKEPVAVIKKKEEPSNMIKINLNEPLDTGINPGSMGGMPWTSSTYTNKSGEIRYDALADEYYQDSVEVVEDYGGDYYGGDDNGGGAW